MAKQQTDASSDGGSIVFETTLTAFGNNTGIVVPADVIDRLGGGGRPAVSVDVNGHVFQTTVGVMSGKNLISFSAALRKQTAIAAGDAIRVQVALATAPREVIVPDDLAKALAADGVAREFFATLSNSLQRFHVDNINGAKTAETRQRRIDKAIDLFRAGKQR